MSFREDIQDKRLWLAFILYAGVTFWAVLHHHPWRDEAQSWLIVRDLGLWELIRQMPYEGTPPLWHLLVMPLAKGGLPYVAQGWLHYGLALGAMFLLVFAAPLPRAIRLISPFGYYFLFEYSVVARSYVLTVLLLLLVAVLYPGRIRHPLRHGLLIALLAWANAHTLMAAVALGVLFALDLFRQGIWAWRRLVGLGIAGLGILSVPVLLMPHADQMPAVGGGQWLILPWAGVAAIWPGLQAESFRWLWPLALVWLPLVAWLPRGWPARFFVLSTWAWLGFIFLTKHPGYLNHYGLIQVFFLFSVCLGEAGAAVPEAGWPLRRKAAAGLYALVLLADVAYAAVFYAHHRGCHFSGAREMATFIRAAGLEGEHLAAHPAYIGTALLPYLPGQRLYQVQGGRTGTFMTWTQAYYDGLFTPPSRLYRDMLDHYAQLPDPPDSFLFLSSQPVLDQPNWELLFCNTRPSLKPDEFFYLYRVRMPASFRASRISMAVHPESAVSLNNAAWLAATDPESTPETLAQAVAHARRAVELTDGRTSAILSTLAVTLAATGDFAGALEAGERALALAEAEADPALAERIRQRLELFRAGQPYREEAGAAGSR